MLCVLDTHENSAKKNMSLDQDLLTSLDKEPILHLYEWQKKSITYGYFLDPVNFLNMQAIEDLEIDIAQRPTGGGVTLHFWDYAFSFLMPSQHVLYCKNPIENYHFVNRIVAHSVEKAFGLNHVNVIFDSYQMQSEIQTHFCMARPTKYDVVSQGLKVAGSAQRNTKKGYLHQGMISLCAPDKALLESILLHSEDVIKSFQAFSFAPLGLNPEPNLMASAKLILKNELIKSFQNFLKIV